MKIDSHQHFWKYTPVDYPWIQDHWSIRQSYLPVDLAPLLQASGMDGCVAVQARQSIAETEWLLELAESHPMILGVVGWVDLCGSGLRSQLEKLADHPKLVGVRHVVQDEPDDDFMLRPDFQAGIHALQEFGLTYDILIYPKQLPAAQKLLASFPNQPFVLDHLAKPSIAKGLLEPWRTQVKELSKYENVQCKVSGMVTEAVWKNWKVEDFRPFLEIVLDAFGAERLLFGSDWPVALLSAEYQEVYGLAFDFFSQLSQVELNGVFGENAASFYGLSAS